ncbi:MAG: D-sedoheptulose-7-phosphate isomerase [Petrotogales bacterium]
MEYVIKTDDIEYITKYFEDAKDVLDHLSKEDISKVIQVLLEARNTGKKVFICGNGGSASTATHMACDLFKLGGIKAISLNENMPLATALINDEGWGELYVQQLERLYEGGDVLITISVHGGTGEDKAGLWSQNLVKAIDCVNNHQGTTIGFSGFNGGLMKDITDVCVVVPFNSTPLVESFHIVLEHLIAFRLHEGKRV